MLALIIGFIVIVGISTYLVVSRIRSERELYTAGYESARSWANELGRELDYIELEEVDEENRRATFTVHFADGTSTRFSRFVPAATAKSTDLLHYLAGQFGIDRVVHAWYERTYTGSRWIVAPVY